MWEITVWSTRGQIQHYPVDVSTTFIEMEAKNESLHEGGGRTNMHRMLLRWNK